jgi:hypothetical protein
MPRARIPELGERVQMGKFATDFRGVWGEVIKVDDNPPPGPILAKATGGDGHVEIYIAAFYPGTTRALLYNGRRVVIKASPYELDGGLLDDRPVWQRS